MGSEGFIFTSGVLIFWSLIGLVVAAGIKLIWRRERLPGWPIIWFALIGTFVTVVVASPLAEPVPPEHEYRGPQFCLEEGRWDDVIAYTREFGIAHGLRFVGGANEYEGAGLNIGLLKGGGLFLEEEITLYVMSHPFNRRKSDFVAITREKLTPADLALAKKFEAGLLKFSCS